MKQLEQHGARLATDAAERRRRQLAEQIGQELNAGDVSVDNEEVAASGGHLLRQWLGNADLRSLRGRR